MIIGFDAKRAFYNRSGLGNYSRNLIGSLYQFAPQIEPYLFTPGDSDLLFKFNSNSKIIKPSGVFKLFPSFWRSIYLSRVIKKLPIQLYHGLSHELPSGIEKIGIPSIVTMHDLIFLRYPEFYKPADRRMYEQKFRYAAKSASKLIAISNQTKDDLISFFKVDEKKIEVIYQSCFPVFYEPIIEIERMEVLKKYGLPSTYFITVGNVEERKNLKGILAAMAMTDLDLPLVVVGKPGSVYVEVMEIIHRKKLANRVLFIPNLDFHDLPALYQSALFSVYPSFFEGFGLPVLESQASSCPVICSNISSMPEAGGKGAYYIDPCKPEEIAEAIKLFTNSSELRDEFRLKGLSNSERFREEHIVNRLLGLYEQTIADHNF